LADGTTKHLHGATPAEIAVRKVVMGVKRRAKEHPNEPPARVMAAAVGVLGEEVANLMPERRHLKRCVFRRDVSLTFHWKPVTARQPVTHSMSIPFKVLKCCVHCFRDVNRWQNEERPPLPINLGDINIEAPYDQTEGGEPFLLYDSGREDNNRLLIFTTIWALRILALCDMFFSDGTFKTVPGQFAQLFTVHGRFRKFVFPLVFCFTSRLTEQTYRTVYQVLKRKAREIGVVLAPEVFMMDFELANMNAARISFVSASIKGCLFHFTQSLYRYLISLGLKQEYEILESPIRKQAIALFALPFIPLEEIVEVFENITEGMDPRLDALISYIDSTYVQGPLRRRRRVPPRFPPQVWNVYDLVLNGDERTNNAVEGWHNHLQKMMVVHHGSLWRFLDILKKEETQIRNTIVQVQGGHTNIREPVNKKYKTNQRQIENIVNQCEAYKLEGNVVGYLRAIGYRLKTGPPGEREE